MFVHGLQTPNPSIRVVRRDITIRSSLHDNARPLQLTTFLPLALVTSKDPVLSQEMEQWNEGHLELFEALAAVCDRVGNEDARDLAHSIKRPNGKTFVQRLRDLQQKAEIVDFLAKDSHLTGIPLSFDAPAAFARQLQELRWKAHILDTLYDEDYHVDVPHTISDPRVKELAIRLHNLREKAQLFDNVNGLSKHDNSDIRSRLRDALYARKELISKMRKVRENRAQWVQYANSLSKRLEKREATLSSHGLLTGVPFQSKGSGIELPTTSKPEALVNKLPTNDQLAGISEAAPTRLSFDLPETDNFDLDGDTMIGTPSAKTPKLMTLSPTPGEPNRDIGPVPELANPIFTPKHYHDCSGPPTELDQYANLATTVDELPRHSLIRERSTILNVSSGIPLASSPNQHTSSTQGDVDDLNPGLPISLGHHPTSPPLAKYEPNVSSDSPVVVSTRAVRKRKAKASPQRTKIKKETECSSPVAFLGFSVLEPQESLDLDEIGPKTITPKKRRLHNRLFSSAEGDEAFEAGKYHYKHPPTFNSAQVKSPSSIHPRRPQIKSPLDTRQISTLQPKSPNKLILPRTSDKDLRMKRRRVRDGSTGEVPFAEDGENASQINAAAQSRKHLGIKPDGSGRLDSLLEAPSLKNFTAKTPARPINARTPRTTTHGSRGGHSTMKNSEGNLAERMETSTHTPDEPQNEPLRARPLWRLGLENFKVNPDYNQGYDFAFRDVVRGREQRKCLPGCTKPECCGTMFRKLAELTRGQVKNRTPDEEKEDERLLQDYLGGNIHKLQAMSKDERQETLIQAKARDLANKHGKHRHAFERRQSPPGFWRADFPTTQEAQSDRAEAADFERELVGKRYEEAMREGGKWLFRDE